MSGYHTSVSQHYREGGREGGRELLCGTGATCGVVATCGEVTLFPLVTGVVIEVLCLAVSS